MFDQKEIAEKVMLDEAIEVNFEELQQLNAREEMESDIEDEDNSVKSEEYNNDQMIDEILELVNPDDEQVDKIEENNTVNIK